MWVEQEQGLVLGKEIQKRRRIYTYNFGGDSKWHVTEDVMAKPGNTAV